MKPQMTAKKSQFLNYAEDGIKIRSAKFGAKKVYNRKNKEWKKDW